MYTQRHLSGRVSLYFFLVAYVTLFTHWPFSVIKAVEIFFHFLRSEKCGGTPTVSILLLRDCSIKSLPSEICSLKWAQVSRIKNSLELLYQALLYPFTGQRDV